MSDKDLTICEGWLSEISNSEESIHEFYFRVPKSTYPKDYCYVTVYDNSYGSIPDEMGIPWGDIRVSIRKKLPLAVIDVPWKSKPYYRYAEYLGEAAQKYEEECKELEEKKETALRALKEKITFPLQVGARLLLKADWRRAIIHKLTPSELPTYKLHKSLPPFQRLSENPGHCGEGISIIYFAGLCIRVDWRRQQRSDFGHNWMKVDIFPDRIYFPDITACFHIEATPRELPDWMGTDVPQALFSGDFLDKVYGYFYNGLNKAILTNFDERTAGQTLSDELKDAFNITELKSHVAESVTSYEIYKGELE